MVTPKLECLSRIDCWWMVLLDISGISLWCGRCWAPDDHNISAKSPGYKPSQLTFSQPAQWQTVYLCEPIWTWFLAKLGFKNWTWNKLESVSSSQAGLWIGRMLCAGWSALGHWWQGDNCCGECVIKTSYVNISCWRATTLELGRLHADISRLLFESSCQVPNSFAFE